VEKRTWKQNGQFSERTPDLKSYNATSETTVEDSKEGNSGGKKTNRPGGEVLLKEKGDRKHIAGIGRQRFFPRGGKNKSEIWLFAEKLVVEMHGGGFKRWGAQEETGAAGAD